MTKTQVEVITSVQLALLHCIRHVRVGVKSDAFAMSARCPLHATPDIIAAIRPQALMLIAIDWG